MKKKLFFVTMLTLTLVLGACAPGNSNVEMTATDEPMVAQPAATEPAEPMPAEDTPVAGSGADDCPIATEDTNLLRDPRHGFACSTP